MIPSNLSPLDKIVRDEDGERGAVAGGVVGRGDRDVPTVGQSQDSRIGMVGRHHGICVVVGAICDRAKM